MLSTTAKVYGAISLVNAIATGRGATMGIGLETTCTLDVQQGTGISVKSGMRSLSSRLVEKTVQKIVSKRDLAKYNLGVRLDSDVPSGYGLKSSSAISLAVAMCCSKALKPTMTDRALLVASAEASIEAHVSITGAYDDACACYYGGINITDNSARRLIRRDKSPDDLGVIVFIPRVRRRGRPQRLSTVKSAMTHAWDLVRDHGDYWNAMTLNGLAASPILCSDPSLVTSLIEAGALGASVSGNGPAVAAVANTRNVNSVKRIFSGLDGRVITTVPNCKKARCSIL